jgi:hypothetical protein
MRTHTAGISFRAKPETEMQIERLQDVLGSKVSAVIAHAIAATERAAMRGLTADEQQAYLNLRLGPAAWRAARLRRRENGAAEDELEAAE